MRNLTFKHSKTTKNATQYSIKGDVVKLNEIGKDIFEVSSTEECTTSNNFVGDRKYSAEEAKEAELAVLKMFNRLS